MTNSCSWGNLMLHFPDCIPRVITDSTATLSAHRVTKLTKVRCIAICLYSGISIGKLCSYSLYVSSMIWNTNMFLAVKNDRQLLQ